MSWLASSRLRITLLHRAACLLALAVLFAAPDARALLPKRDAKQDQALAEALFTSGKLLHIKLEISQADIGKLRGKPHEYIVGKVREGDKVYEDVGIHLKGSAGSFRQIDDKAGFTLNFNKFEASDLFHGLEKFHLNNSVQDPTYLTEWLCNQMFRDAGVPAPRAAHAMVELNGRKMGFYVLLEANDTDFLKRYFKNTRGNLYGQPGAGDIVDELHRMEGKGPLDRADLNALAAITREPDPAKRWQGLQQKLDVPRFLSFMGMEIFFSHWDGYTFARHNYRVYHDLDTDKMVFFPHDIDQLMADPNVPIVPGVNGVVAQAIMNTPEAKRLYMERVVQLYHSAFKASEQTNRLAQYVAKLAPQIRTFNTNFAREFVDTSRSLTDRIMARDASLKRQVAQIQPAKTLQFANNIAKPAKWEPKTEQGNAKLQRVQVENKPVLYIKGEGNTIASWRTPPLLLPAGKYVFSGNVKSANVDAFKTEAGLGGGIRISGANRTNKVAGTANWTKLQHEFALDATGEVVLVCELRANKGEIWFQSDTLQIQKLK